MTTKLDLDTERTRQTAYASRRKLWEPFAPADSTDDCLYILDERTRAIADELRARQLCPHGYATPKGGDLPCPQCAAGA